MLTPPGPLPLPVGAQDGKCRDHSRDVIGKRTRHKQRGLPHHAAAEDLAAHGSDDIVGRLIVAVGAGLAEVGDGGNDEPWKALRYRNGIEPDPGQ